MVEPTREKQHQDPGGGTVATRWFNSVTVETVYTGYVTISMMQQAEADFAALLSERKALYRLVDTSPMTASDPAIKGGVEELWQRFKKHGGREILFVSKAPITKMQGSVVAMTEAVRIKFFDTRAQALLYLATLPTA